MVKSGITVTGWFGLAVQALCLVVTAVIPLDAESSGKGYALLLLLIVSTAVVWLLAITELVALVIAYLKTKSFKATCLRYPVALISTLSGTVYPVFCLLLIRMKS